MFKGSVLVFQFDEFLLVALEHVDFILEVANDEVFLVGLDLVRGVEVG